MSGLKGLGGGGICCDQIVCGIKLEMKVMHLHKIKVEKISLFHLKKCAVNDF